nr:endonuclease/exonuclease/phosphatase family protein [Pseudomonadota bacterium]
MKVVSWNLLRLTGAAVGDVAKLIDIQKPDLLLMQEATQNMEGLPGLVGGHFYRLSWLGRIHGLAVWSPTHFPRPVALSLPASRLPGRLPRRRAQIIQMGEITFANVHLSHGQLLNRRQLARIAAALQGKPSAIIGDYNAVGPVF